jgi:hypothetical protein
MKNFIKFVISGKCVKIWKNYCVVFVNGTNDMSAERLSYQKLIEISSIVIISKIL